MLRSYLKIAWRSLARNRVSSVINLLGLSLGIACCLLITAYVLDELTYDRFHQNADRIVLLQQFENSPGSGGNFAADLKNRFALIDKTLRLTRLQPLVAHQSTAAYEPHFWLADSSAFDVFTLPLLQGNPRTALAEQYGVVLSESMTRKYFGTENPLGRPLRINDKTTLHVTGVMRDLPANAHQKIDFLASYANANELAGYDVTTNYWGGDATWTYLLLPSASAAATLQAQLPSYVKQLNDPNASVWKLNLIPLRDIYLRTNLVATNRLTYVYVFAGVALLILGMACFNYVNLTTAQATQRAREVGVRKVLGSSFGQLWRQFLGETVVFMAISVGLAIGLVLLLLPAFNELTGKPLTSNTILDGPRLAGILAGLTLVSLVAGGYPALVLSSFRPVRVLNGQGIPSNAGGWLRQTLVVGQFAVSVGMVVATLVVYGQLTYVRTKNVGYQRNQLLTLDLRDAPPETKAQFKREVEALSGVLSVTRAMALPGSGGAIGTKLVTEFLPKSPKTGGIQRLNIDPDFLRTFTIHLAAGRNFDPNRPADKTAFLVNRAAMAYFGWKTIAGKRTGYYRFANDPNSPGGYKEVAQVGDVIGLIDDYNHADLKRSVEPMLYSLTEGWESSMAVSLRAGAMPTTVRQIGTIWKTHFINRPFTYAFLDDTFNLTYQSEERTGQVFTLFAGLAILISCLGLFGLATFAAQQRTKEIGIRKVLGASVGSLVTLLSKDFLKLVLVAIAIASPLSYYAMNRWLSDFAYRIDISWWVFALAGFLAIGIALLTVSLQSIRAALVNPVSSLRSE